MNFLVLYASTKTIDRKTHLEHLYSFQRYTKGNRFYYLNVLEPQALNARTVRMPFDVVIFHTLFLSRRYNPLFWKPLYDSIRPKLQRLSGYKIMLPQDDYNFTADLWRMASECNVDHIFSVIPEDQLSVVYPKDKIGHATVSTVLTGYIDEDSITAVETMRKTCVQKLDIGYRAKRLPYWFGWFGQLKYNLADRFTDRLASFADISADIANTDGAKNVYFGDDWMRFLLSCRCMLGCLGGSSILDPDGSIAKRVDDYCAEHPEAEYDEVHQACFPTEEDSVRGFMLSPRIFECAIAKTCQLLVEGDYYGIIQPGVDYIEIKQDFSNVDEVLEKVRDHEYCERIAEQCYEHVVRPGDSNNPYTYRWFADHIIDHIKKHRDADATAKMTPRMHKYMARRCAFFSSALYYKLNKWSIILGMLETKEGRIRIRTLAALWIKKHVYHVGTE